MKVGIIGSGQLGQMMSWFGEKTDTEFFSLSPNKPLSFLRNNWIEANYSDSQGIQEFAKSVDVITYEFESFPFSVYQQENEFPPVFPPLSLLQKTQDRLHEKQYLNNLDIKTAPYIKIDSFDDLRSGIQKIGFPAILKSRLFGYDGKGQFRIKNEDNLNDLENLDYSQKWILEGFVKFEREVSLIGARNEKGDIVFYPLVHNIHREGILDVTIRSKDDSLSRLQKSAEDIMTSIMLEENYVGVMTIEFFLVDNELVINEMACRVHNSGHWTLKGANISQFELHLLSISGKDLPQIEVKKHIAMINVISKHPDKIDLEKLKNSFYVDYGKSEAPNRKLGHINIIRDSLDDLKVGIEDTKKLLSY